LDNWNRMGCQTQEGAFELQKQMQLIRATGQSAPAWVVRHPIVRIDPELFKVWTGFTSTVTSPAFKPKPDWLDF
jgi:hypothetical protein